MCKSNELILSNPYRHHNIPAAESEVLTTNKLRHPVDNYDLKISSWNNEPAGVSVENKKPSGKHEYNMERQLATEEHIWYKRFGHTIHIAGVRKQLQNGSLPHVECRATDWESCAKGKYRRRSKGLLTSSNKIGWLHCGTKAKVSCTPHGGHKYFFTVIEIRSGLVYACPLRSKDEASEVLLSYVKRFGKQCSTLITKVCTDNESKFSCKLLQSMMMEH